MNKNKNEFHHKDTKGTKNRSFKQEVTEETETHQRKALTDSGRPLSLFTLFPPVKNICLCVFVVKFSDFLP
jgi:hypothetical protein